jgi:hypothetical protein
MSLFLLAPDIRRLAGFFILNRTTTPRALGRPFANRWLNRAALAFKIVFLGWSVVYPAIEAWDFAQTQATAPRPALYGLYEIESFARNGQSVAPDIGDEKRWRRMVINRSGRLAVQFMDDSLQRFLVTDNANEGKLELTPRWDPSKLSSLAYRKEDDDRLALEGDFFGENLQVILRRVQNPKFLLVDRGFHWINEKPFNR